MGVFSSIRSLPKQVWFILASELCERFSFYGMKTILYLYLVNEHKLTTDMARVVQHLFNGLCYLTPLIGAIVADSCVGKYWVILVVSLIYVGGQGLISVGSIPSLPEWIRKILDFSGLFVIAVGTGGIKPCVAAFGADQIPSHMEEIRAAFFSYFYMAVNGGAVLSTFVTPQLRDLSCAGRDTCYPLAFGMPGVLMLVAFILFLSGTCWYIREPSAREFLPWTIVGSISLSLYRKIRGFFNKSRAPERSTDEDVDSDEALKRGVASTEKNTHTSERERMMDSKDPEIQTKPDDSAHKISASAERGKTSDTGIVENEEKKKGFPTSLSFFRAKKSKNEPKKTNKEKMDQTKTVLNERCKWLDAASPRFNEMQIWGVKCLLSVMWVLWPICFFWFLYDQQGTTWIEQGTKMNGKMGSVYINTETMQLVNALFIITMVPICRYAVYPLVEKCVHLTYLRKLGVGLVFAAFSFFVSGSLQLWIDSTLIGQPGEGMIFVQSLNDTLWLSESDSTIGKEMIELNDTRRELAMGKYHFVNPNAADKADSQLIQLEIDAENLTRGYVFHLEPNRHLSWMFFDFHQDEQKLHQTKVVLFPATDLPPNWTYYVEEDETIQGGPVFKGRYNNSNDKGGQVEKGDQILLKHTIIDHHNYTIWFGPNCARAKSSCAYSVTVENLAAPVYVIYVHQDQHSTVVSRVIEPFHLHLTLQIPQIFLITFGEVWLSVSALEFVYSQSPPFMKSIMQAVVTMTISMGNLLQALWAAINPLAGKMAIEMFIYGGITLGVVIIYLMLACQYKYIDGFPTESSPIDDKEDDNDKENEETKKNETNSTEKPL